MMLGLPSVVSCPKCKNDVNTYADDYDIDVGNPNPSPGIWILSCGCGTCNHSFKPEFKLTVTIVNPIRRREIIKPNDEDDDIEPDQGSERSIYRW